MNPRAKFFISFFLWTTTALAADDRVKIDNDFARVLVVDSAVAAKSQLHEHKMNRVMVYLDAGKMTLTDSEGKQEILTFKKDEALWSAATTRPHISENQSGHNVKIVEIELKTPPSGAGKEKLSSELDWVKMDRRRYKVEFENDQVRVVRARYRAHEKGVLHEHPFPLLVVYLTGGEMKVSPPGGEPVTVSYERGDVKFGGASKHIEENLSEKPLEVLVVEFKN